MASYRLKRKTYAFLGIGNMMKNWNAGGFVNKAKAIGTGAVYAGGATALATAPTIANKITGGDVNN